MRTQCSSMMHRTHMLGHYNDPQAKRARRRCTCAYVVHKNIKKGLSIPMLYLRRECFHHSSILLCDKPSRTHRTSPPHTRHNALDVWNRKYPHDCLWLIFGTKNIIAYWLLLLFYHRFHTAKFWDFFPSAPSHFGSVHSSYLDSNSISKSIMFSV